MVFVIDFDDVGGMFVVGVFGMEGVDCVVFYGGDGVFDKVVFV